MSLVSLFYAKIYIDIVGLKDTVKEGESLAFGMKQYPDVFENIYIQWLLSTKMN